MNIINKIQAFTKNVYANKIIKCSSKYLYVKREPYKRFVILAKKIKKITNKPRNKLTENDKNKIKILGEIFQMWSI